MSGKKFPLWTVLAVVLVAALVVGSGVLSSSPPTPAQRAAAIESVIRCPSCEDLSVANSSAATAVAVRTTVRQLVAQGETDQQIENYLVARYGSSIVLDPPARGWSLLVWLVPVIGGLVAIAALAVFLLRRRGAVGPDPKGDGETGPADVASLEERRSFLERSLSDADAEFLAGDLSDQDYLALRQRDMARLALVETRLVEARQAAAVRVPVGALVAGAPAVGNGSSLRTARAESTPSVPGPEPGSDRRTSSGSRSRTRSRRSWWFLGGAIAALGAALIVAVSLFATNRLPGQTATGSINLSQSQQIEESLAQAATYQNEGQLGPAAQLYQSVLVKQSDNEVALAQLGWLEFETGQQGNSRGLIDDGIAKLHRAVQLDPGDYAVRLYLGTVLLQHQGDAAGAVAQYRLFLADGPPATLVDQAAPEIRQAYQEAGVPLPTGLPAG